MRPWPAATKPRSLGWAAPRTQIVSILTDLDTALEVNVLTIDSLPEECREKMREKRRARQTLNPSAPRPRKHPPVRTARESRPSGQGAIMRRHRGCSRLHTRTRTQAFPFPSLNSSCSSGFASSSGYGTA